MMWQKKKGLILFYLWKRQNEKAIPQVDARTRT